MSSQDTDGAPAGGPRAREVAAAVARGTLPAAAVLRDARARRDAWEPWLGAIVTPSSDVPSAGPVGALAGVVAVVKDLIAVRGLPRLCGAPELIDTVPSVDDAPVVRALREAGASVLGTAQTHQFAYGIVTPQTRNPRAAERLAGGSSGGSAAAIAAGIAHVALGTDTGGSIRIPAACCGVVGLKPTFGLLSVEGVQPLAPSLDTVGPLAGDVADLALALSALTGTAFSAGAPATLRVGVPEQTTGTDVDPQVRACLEHVMALLARAGVEVREVSLPALEEAPRANGIVLGVEALAVHGDLLARRPDGWWPTVRERLERARALTPEDVSWAHDVRGRLRAEFDAALESVDVLLTPTLPCTVPPVGAEQVVLPTGTEPVTAVMTRFTNPWNLLGVPAGSVPAGRDDAGAPIGVQLVGAAGTEDQVLGAMAAVEAVVGGPWSVEPPPDRAR